MTGGAFTRRGRGQFLETVQSPRLEKPFELSELHRVLRDLSRGLGDGARIRVRSAGQAVA
jgi:hypothetical protein